MGCLELCGLFGSVWVVWSCVGSLAMRGLLGAV